MARLTYNAEDVPDQVLDQIGKNREDLTHLELRFLVKVEYVEPEGCWVWTSAVNEPQPGRKYGRIWMGGEDGRAHRAHRVALNLFGDGVDDDEVVRHRCPRRDTLCVAPAHLKTGSLSDNCIDALKDGSHDRKLSNDDVRDIRRRAENGEYYGDIANDHGVSKSMVCMIKQRERYAWIDDNPDRDDESDE